MSEPGRGGCAVLKLWPPGLIFFWRVFDLVWGTKRIAAELGCSRNTVKRYLAAGGWVANRQPRRKRRLDGRPSIA
jgi:hypothetical protein